MAEDESSLSAKFVKVGILSPLGRRDIIPIGIDYNQNILDPENLLRLNGYYRDLAVNFRYILESGRVPVADNRERLSSNNPEFLAVSDFKEHTIDLGADDAYTRALARVESRVATLLESREDIRLLLAREVWTMEDRMQWEEKLSNLVSRELSKEPGLGIYRTSSGQFIDMADSNSTLPRARLRAIHVNELSTDIEHDSKFYEFDCEVMSITEGIILQRLEDRFLPSQLTASDALKSASAYFYATGQIVGHNLGSIIPATQGAHAFIVSSATGAVIEATHVDPSRSNYQRPQFGASFSTFTEGLPQTGPRGSNILYFSNAAGFNDVTAQRVYAAALIDGLNQKIENFEKQYESLNAIPEYHVLKSLLMSRDPSRSDFPQIEAELNALVENPELRQALASTEAAMNNILMDIYYAPNIISNTDFGHHAFDFILKAHGDRIASFNQEIPVFRAVEDGGFFMMQNQVPTQLAGALEEMDLLFQKNGWDPELVKYSHYPGLLP